MRLAGDTRQLLITESIEALAAWSPVPTRRCDGFQALMAL
jgi:hypothetical protein